MSDPVSKIEIDRLKEAELAVAGTNPLDSVKDEGQCEELLGQLLEIAAMTERRLEALDLIKELKLYQGRVRPQPGDTDRSIAIRRFWCGTEDPDQLLRLAKSYDQLVEALDLVESAKRNLASERTPVSAKTTLQTVVGAIWEGCEHVKTLIDNDELPERKGKPDGQDT